MRYKFVVTAAPKETDEATPMEVTIYGEHDHQDAYNLRRHKRRQEQAQRSLNNASELLAEGQQAADSNECNPVSTVAAASANAMPSNVKECFKLHVPKEALQNILCGAFFYNAEVS